LSAHLTKQEERLRGQSEGRKGSLKSEMPGGGRLKAADKAYFYTRMDTLQLHTNYNTSVTLQWAALLSLALNFQPAEWTLMDRLGSRQSWNSSN